MAFDCALESPQCFAVKMTERILDGGGHGAEEGDAERDK